MTYPFRELGWQIGEEISPHVYTKKQWDGWTFLPFHKNVERDKIIHFAVWLLTGRGSVLVFVKNMKKFG